MYRLVEFIDNNEIAIVPDSWMNDDDDVAVWPSHIRMTGKINLMVERKVKPGESWPSYPIRLLYSSDDYDVVRRKLKRAEVDSDLESTALETDREESCRKSKRRKKARVYSSSEDESDEESQPQTRDFGPSSMSVSLPKPPQKAPSLRDAGFGRTPPATPSHQEVSEVNPTAQSLSSVFHSCSPSGQGRKQSESGSAVARDVRMFTILEKLAQKQASIEEKLNQVLAVVRRLASGSSDATSLPDGINLPVNSEEEIVALEENLADESTYNALISHLSLLGGLNTPDATRRAMSYCMSNQLATGYNWYGLKQKRAFSKLRLASAIQKAVMRSTRCTLTDVEKVGRDWLRTASDRDGGRKKRSGAKDNQPLHTN